MRIVARGIDVRFAGARRARGRRLRARCGRDRRPDRPQRRRQDDAAARPRRSAAVARRRGALRRPHGARDRPRRAGSPRRLSRPERPCRIGRSASSTVVALGRLPHRRPFSPPSAGRSRRDRGGARRRRRRGAARPDDRRRFRAASGRGRCWPARWRSKPRCCSPTSRSAALDPLHQLRAMALLRAAARKGAGVVAVLHDLTLAARFCDRLIVLAEGADRRRRAAGGADRRGPGRGLWRRGAARRARRRAVHRAVAGGEAGRGSLGRRGRASAIACLPGPRLDGAAACQAARELSWKGHVPPVRHRRRSCLVPQPGCGCCSTTAAARPKCARRGACRSCASCSTPTPRSTSPSSIWRCRA